MGGCFIALIYLFQYALNVHLLFHYLIVAVNEISACTLLEWFSVQTGQKIQNWECGVYRRNNRTNRTNV